MLDFLMSRRSILVLVVLMVLVALAALLLWKIVRREIAERTVSTTLGVDGGRVQTRLTLAT